MTVDYTDEMPPVSGMPMVDIVALYSRWSITDLIATAHVVTQEMDYSDWTATNGHSIERGDFVHVYRSGVARPIMLPASDFRELVSDHLYTLRVMNKDIARFVAPE